MTLHVVGVRHHSPACARVVIDAIRTLRPRHVLIEGPADMNDRIGELLLPHKLPLALFTYFHGNDRTHASWTPFCRHAPEWVALQEGHAIGAQVRFIDLPAWDAAFAGVRNRYRDRRDRATEYVEALCAKFGFDDTDTLWDHLFEQPMPVAELAQRLHVYFESLRADDDADDRDVTREAFMARFIRWALDDCDANGGDVLVVCGGYHAPVLARVASDGVAEMPRVAEPEANARHGTYLVPYSFRRLDSFVGYESGLPSPAFYDALWDDPEGAAEKLLGDATQRLRKKKQPVSAADFIASLSLARGLARTRGHATLSRTDVLDGIAGALVKDALDAPLPWSYRGTLHPKTDPLLVEVVAAFSGEEEGRLADATPRPPLLADVFEQLNAAGLTPRKDAFTVTIDLTKDVGRSRILHRLRVLDIPGFRRAKGPQWATDVETAEVWEIRQLFETESALIEAAAWGATLETAAAAKLSEALEQAAGKLSRLAVLLGEAVFTGIETLSAQVLDRVAEGAQREPSFAELGDAGVHLLALFRHGALLGVEGAQAVGVVLSAIYSRGLWLVEGLQGETAPANEAELRAVALLRDLVRFASGALLADRAQGEAVMQRRGQDRQAPPAIRGAAIGFLWSTGQGSVDDASRGLAGVSRPESIGDFLAGLFSVAREEVMGSEGLVAAIDSALNALESHDFLVSLPAMRMAFSFFPPRERERMAQRIVRLHQGVDGTAANARSLLRAEVSADVVVRGLAIEEEVTRRAERYGLA
jgi:hypothetical protein